MRAGVTEVVAEPSRQTDLRRGDRPADGAQAGRARSAGGRSRSSAPRAASARRRSRSTSRPRWRSSSRRATLLIDLHLAYGDAAVFLGAEPRFSVVDALENMHRLDEAFFKSLVVADQVRRRPAGVVRSRHARRRSTCGGIRTLLEFAATHYRYIVLDVPRSDAAVLDALESRRADRRRRQPGAGDRPQREPHGGGAAPAVRQGPRHGGRQPRRRQAEIGHEDVERAVGGAGQAQFPERLPSRAAGAEQGHARRRSTITTSSPARSTAFARDAGRRSTRSVERRRSRPGCFGLFGIAQRVHRRRPGHERACSAVIDRERRRPIPDRRTTRS